MSLLLKLAGARQRKNGMKALEHLEQVTRDPMGEQEKLLMQIISDNKDTEYGKKYDFASIKTIEDYREKVPVTTYDDYAEYIERMSDKCEKNLITVYPMALYNKSSGTVGVPKRIPMSEPSREKFFIYNADYEYGINDKYFGKDITKGRSISLTISNPDIPTMNDGVPYGSVSDTATLQAKPVWTKLFTSPVAASFAGAGVNTRYLHARYALTDPKPTKIGSSFISFVLEFFRYIENNWELLVNDIEKGTIDASIELPDDVRADLTKELKPNPKRAAELRSIFEKGFDEPFAPKVWKNLKVISGAATGSFKEYAAKMQERYTGDIALFRRGVSASEGAFSVSTELDSCDSVLLPDVVFYEFLPEGSDDDFSKLVTMDKLEKGEKYELFITNLSGFYRYRMKDVFLVTGKHNSTPTIEFMYRSDKTVSIMGEKTTEIAVRTAAEETAKRCGFELVDSTMYPDLDKSRYVYFFEVDKVSAGLTYDKIRDTLEEELAKANPSMGDKVKKGLCAPTELLFLQPETFILYREMLQMKGYSVGQTKPVTVISNEVQRKFYFALTEEADEALGAR